MTMIATVVPQEPIAHESLYIGDHIHFIHNTPCKGGIIISIWQWRKMQLLRVGKSKITQPWNARAQIIPWSQGLFFFQVLKTW